MIEVSKRVPVNEPGQPVLTRSDVWKGLVMKADNALPFVPAMTHCKVLNRESDMVFVREIEFRGERCRERITLVPEQRVEFVRLDGSVLGTILNLIEEDESGLGLRFSFKLKLAGVEDGSPEEIEYGKVVEKDYLKAVDATLAAIRKMKSARDSLIRRYYDVVDSMDLDAFKAMHSANARVTFANFPTVQGADRIAEAIGQFWSTIRGMKHEFVNRWDHPQETILEAAVHYTRKDGSVVTLPCVSILRPEGDQVGELRIFIDVAPVYAEQKIAS
ncbi:AtaL-like protein [Pseudorhodoplanes sp.]|uniref:AtaL-like protein n=1 Tax=Pseudorhodoplanes sp. TaxID=1934341 RepID=UPI002C634440|nr:AtaL-like protein [Pseudorhodoplanes sp.]HWV43122.1 AtaL-like protein [Pseudorhodoplanes sp.]